MRTQGTRIGLHQNAELTRHSVSSEKKNLGKFSVEAMICSVFFLKVDSIFDSYKI